MVIFWGGLFVSLLDYFHVLLLFLFSFFFFFIFILLFHTFKLKYDANLGSPVPVKKAHRLSTLVNGLCQVSSPFALVRIQFRFRWGELHKLLMCYNCPITWSQLTRLTRALNGERGMKMQSEGGMEGGRDGSVVVG